MSATVWVQAWQLQCCGEPFSVGDAVQWTPDNEPDRDWLDAALGTEVARDISHAEEHHGHLPDDHPVTRGTVLAIKAAYSRYAPLREDTSLHYPVPGSAVLRDVTRADGSESNLGEAHFNGYIVELALSPDSA